MVSSRSAAVMAFLGLTAAALPDTTQSWRCKEGKDYGDVKPVQVKLNYRPGRKKGKRK